MKARTVPKRLAIFMAVALAVTASVLVLSHSRQKVANQKKSGDLMQFVLSVLQRHGAAAAVTHGLPAFRAEWNCTKNPKGVEIRLDGDREEELVHCFEQAFGPSLFRKDEIRKKDEIHPQLLYFFGKATRVLITDFGVSVNRMPLFGHDVQAENGFSIVVLSGLTDAPIQILCSWN